MCHGCTCGQTAEGAAKKSMILAIVTAVYSLIVMIVSQTPERAYCAKGTNAGEFGGSVDPTTGVHEVCLACEVNQCWDWDAEKSDTLIVSIVVLIVMAVFAWMMMQAKKGRVASWYWKVSVLIALVSCGCSVPFFLYTIFFVANTGFMILMAIAFLLLVVTGVFAFITVCALKGMPSTAVVEPVAVPSVV